MTPETDHELAARLAEKAGGVLLDLRSTRGDQDPKALGKAGDAASHQVLITALADSRRDDAILSEEAADDQVRLKSRRVWIIDPLDGTREFAEKGRADWAVHVALVADGELVAGAVALPAQRMTLTTATALVLKPPTPGTIRMLVSRTRPPAVALDVARELNAELVPMGSAGAKAMAVVLGAGDVYLHAGGQYEWDSAAPVAVATAAGLHVSRLDGSPLQYNQPNPWLPDLLICRPELAVPIIALAQAAAEW
ncbi:MAG TPA: 3'(2'),5'-bisphosphate nucleotidase CysQ [Acidimicrobiales bacterium]|nr:3'(2'),5'-bisphosphate nucleotidase CysQ [Acidimicrobiales bacterium]